MEGSEPSKNDRTDDSSVRSKTNNSDRPITLALDVRSPPGGGEEDVIVELGLDLGKTERTNQGTFGFFNFFQTGQSSRFGFGNCMPNRCCVSLTSVVRKLLRRQLRFHDKASQTGAVMTGASVDGSDNFPVEEGVVGGTSTLKHRSFLPLSPPPPPSLDFPEPDDGRKNDRNSTQIRGTGTRRGEQLGTAFDQEKKAGSKAGLACPVGNMDASYVDCGFEIVDLPVR
jgi:hypothetical protein